MKNWFYFFGGFCLGYLFRQIAKEPTPDIFDDNDQSTEKSEENLENLTYDELYERARALDIPGRSKMNKEELIEALRSQ